MHMQGLDRQDAGSPLGITGLTDVRVGKTCKVESVGCAACPGVWGHVSHSTYISAIYPIDSLIKTAFLLRHQKHIGDVGGSAIANDAPS